MPIEVTARHESAGESVQAYARQKADELAENFSHVEHVHVILDAEKHRRIAEVIVQVKRHGRFESREEHDNIRTAIEEATGKVERQLRKLTEKVHDHKPSMKSAEADRLRNA